MSSKNMDQLETQVTDLHYLTRPPGQPLLGSSVNPSVRSLTTDPILTPRPMVGGSHDPQQQQQPQQHQQLLQQPVMLSAPAGDNSAHASAFSPDTSRAPSTSAKRKPDDEAGPVRQQRSKRNRYISLACNECKRRKIKCNGETPCQRCGNLNLSCLYTPNCCSNPFKESEEYKQMTEKLRRLEEHVESLSQNVSVLRQETQRLAPLHDRILPIPSTTGSPSTSTFTPLHKPELAPIRPHNVFRGPTSISFTVDMAKNTLRNMGYTGDSQEEQNGAATDGDVDVVTHPRPTLQTSSSLSSSNARQHPQHHSQQPDPFWEFNKDEMIRLCRVHEDEVGIMYPVVSIDEVISHVHTLHSWMEAASSKSGGSLLPSDYDQVMQSIATLQLKIIMCSALSVEEHGNSDAAKRLFDTIETTVNRKLMSEECSYDSLPFLALVAGYRFLENNEVLAWRTMGQVVRLTMELGLHRIEGHSRITGEEERRNAINTFWTAYVLDRRWSFGTGLPYVVHDDRIDPRLPMPDEHPYLVAMVTYSRLAAKIWNLVDFFEPAIIRDLQREQFEALDREILQWYETVPAEVRISHFSTSEMPLPSTPSYNLQRLQIWTRLRLNQIRIWLHTPILHSASSINESMHLAQTAVDLAKDTIHFLARLNNGSNLYRRLQVFYHQFLTSAIAVLFLASTHQPVQFSADCRDEFYMALNLIKDLSAKSWISKRLWQTVRSLKTYAPRLGLLQQRENEQTNYNTLPPRSTPFHGGSSSYHEVHDSNRSSPAGSGIASVGSVGSWPQPATAAATAPPPGTTGVPSLGAVSAVSPFSQTPIPTLGPAMVSPAAAGPGPTPSPGFPDIADRLPDIEQSNGVQLQNEMGRIYDRYAAMGVVEEPPRYGPLVTTTSGGGSSGEATEPQSQGESMYEQLKTLF